MPTIERELRRTANEQRVASGDAWLFARHAASVLERLREVAPELVEAVELEVVMYGNPYS